MLERYSDKMRARSATLLVSLEGRLDQILQFWLVVAGLIAAARIYFSPPPTGGTPVATFASYMLVVVAPFASTLPGAALVQGRASAAAAGDTPCSGRQVADADTVRGAARPLYGTTGIMVSLMVGTMLNVPVRAAEYFTAMPPIPAAAPSWLSALHFAMTLDFVMFGSLYMIAFVAALRRVPLFPRLLAAIWMGDLAMQLLTAKLVVAAGPLPPAVATALQSMLEGNVKKVLISAALWLPYLLLSKRVNVTFRHRVPA